MYFLLNVECLVLSTNQTQSEQSNSNISIKSYQCCIKKNLCYFNFSNKTSFLLNMFVPVSPFNKLPTKLFLMKVM